MKSVGRFGCLILSSENVRWVWDSGLDKEGPRVTWESKRERLKPAVSFINAVVESVTEFGSVWEGVG